jgi:hypothetical protein
MKRGKNADTLFSEFWTEHQHHLNENMQPYYLMRWAFREGFAARGERDRKAVADTTGEKHG